MSNTAQRKQVFSVSQKYNEVFSILDKVDNKSEFICQAIIEKFRGSDSIDDKSLELRMRKILKDMISEDNLFIVSNCTTSIPVQEPKTAVIQEVERTPEKEIPQKENDEDEDYLKSVLLNM